MALAIVWTIANPGFEPAIASIVATSGLLIHYQLQPRQGELQLDFGTGKPFEQTEPAGATGKAFRYYYVRVSNPGRANLDNCLVKLTEMKAIDGQPFENVHLPIGLMTQQQRNQNRRGGVFNLRCNESKLVHVAGLDETTPDSEIILAYESGGIPNLVRRGAFLLTVEAFGAEQSDRMRLKVSVTEDGFLRVRQYYGDA